MKKVGIFLNRKKGLSNKRGIVLIGAYFMLLVLTILLVSFMYRIVAESRATIKNKEAMEAFYLAEAGLDHVTKGLYSVFEPYFISQGQKDSSFSWFNDLPSDAKYILPVNEFLGSGQYTVQITNIDTSVTAQVDVTLVSTAQVNNIIKQVTAVIRYELVPSDVFDNAYFINNFGWFWGDSITNQGDVRANGNFSFDTYSPTVNGDIHAAVNDELSATGSIIGNNVFDAIDDYRDDAAATARPTNPSADPQDINGDGIIEEFPYEDGYDGDSEKLANLESLKMPYLGDLQQYKDIAIEQNGKIGQGGVVLVNNVWDTGAGDTIVLIGTAANPIELNGPVVVAGDVIIKGVVSGQGTIYSGRNIHVVGNINYQSSSSWPKPDITSELTDTQNDTRDFLGLAAKGNIVVGDYTSVNFNFVKDFLEPPFTQAYKVDVTDGDNGYIDYYIDGVPYFDGNYLDGDGGRQIDIDGNDTGARKYYESSFEDSYFRSFCDHGFVTNLDAVCYTNHAFTGRIGKTVINGIIVSRDEAIIYSSKLTFNYDVRANENRLGKKIYLPRELAFPRTVYLKKE